MTDMDCIAVAPEQTVNLSGNRHLKVSYASRYPGYVRIPAINMKGRWLETAGFDTGTLVEVRVMQGCIVLTAKVPEPELEQALRRMVKLSPLEQEQVQALIAVIAGKQAD